MNPTSIHDDMGLTPGASLSGLRIQRCCELWCRSQMWLGSGVAVAMARGSSSEVAWEPPSAEGVAQENGKKNKKTIQNKRIIQSGSCHHGSAVNKPD